MSKAWEGVLGTDGDLATLSRIRDPGSGGSFSPPTWLAAAGLHEGARALSLCGAAARRPGTRGTGVPRAGDLVPQRRGSAANHVPQEDGVYIGSTQVRNKFLLLE